jgi:hypothetical protein
MTGRSRPIPDAGGDFDLTAEASPWVFETDVYPHCDLALQVNLEEDHGDDAAPVARNKTLTPQSKMGFGIIEDPWTSGVRTIGFVQVNVTTTLVNPADQAFLARANGESKPSGTLTIFQGYLVEITDIVGLYKPKGTYCPGRPLPASEVVQAGSERIAGYISADNRGRIFTNRLPDGTWASDTQYIDVQVKVTAFGGLTIPEGTKIDWSIEDADDPTNEAKDFHRDWGRYVDANDYDGAGNPLGAQVGDNAAAFAPGNTDESKLFGAAAASPGGRWAAAAGGPAPSVASRTEADTPLTLADPATGKSSVRIHCMKVLGTNLRLRAELIGAPAGYPVFNASTGVMTMWSRIDVEMVRMAGAPSVGGAPQLIPKAFLPACVQLDFQPERVVPGALDKAELSGSDDGAVFHSAVETWVSNAFSHAGQPGWFFMGLARLPYPRPADGGGGTLVVDDSTYKFSGDKVEVSGDASNAAYVEVAWKAPDGKPLSAGFGVSSSVVTAGKTVIKLWPNDAVPEFTGFDADGSTTHAYTTQIFFFPKAEKHSSAAPLVPGGFGAPEIGAKVSVFAPGKTITAGISPTLKNALHPDKAFFAGRTVVFTEAFNPANLEKAVASVMVHEFIHAFGMPHKCGHWNWRTKRERSCCMNYFNTWLLDATNHIVPETVNLMSSDMCGRHLMEVRRVHLEKNLGLNW